jgi:inhibitor of cysteine peptidase
MKNNEKFFTATGTVVFVKLEGGFFGIITDNGNRYVPINLRKEFQKDGLKIKFEAQLRPELSGIHMWGKYIEITNIVSMEDL